MVISSKKVSIVKATPKDLPEVARLSIEMLKYHNTLMDNYFTVYPYEKYVKNFQQKLKDGQYILVAKIDNKIVGFLSAKFKKTPWYKYASVCMIDEISVSEKCRSYGIGTSLIKKTLAVCKKAKIEEVKLDIYNANVGAKRLYERLGFEDLRQQMSFILTKNTRLNTDR